MEERASLLIVDDERGPAESLRMIFKPSYNVYVANGGPEALEILHSRSIDVVTLDLRMPVMSGVEVMERIKAFDSDIEVIVVTGYSSMDSAIRGLRHGVFDYISKPFDVPQICDLVRPGGGASPHQPADQADEGGLPRQPVARVAHAAQRDHRLQHHSGRGTRGRRDAGPAHGARPHPGQLDRTAQPRRRRCSSSTRSKPAKSPSTCTPFNLAETIARTAEKFRAQADERGLEIRTHVAAGAASAISDEEKIERVLWALIDNAIKFTPAGTVSILARRAPQPGAVEIEVSDTGIGMQRDEVMRVLQGLSQADPAPRRRFRGLGLGLRIATRLIEVLGGDLRVRSEADQGTHFIVTLPARAPAAPNPRLH